MKYTVKHNRKCGRARLMQIDRWYAPDVTGNSVEGRQLWVRCNGPECDAILCIEEHELSQMICDKIQTKTRSRGQG